MYNIFFYYSKTNVIPNHSFIEYNTLPIIYLTLIKYARQYTEWDLNCSTFKNLSINTFTTKWANNLSINDFKIEIDMAYFILITKSSFISSYNCKLFWIFLKKFPHILFINQMKYLSDWIRGIIISYSRCTSTKMPNCSLQNMLPLYKTQHYKFFTHAR